jgi:hypothetical protein
MGEGTGAHTGPLREDHDTVTTLENRASGIHRLFVAASTIDRKSPKAVQQPSLPMILEQLTLGHVVDGPTRQRTDHERVEKAAMVGCQQHRPSAGNMLAPKTSEAKIEQKEGHQDSTYEPIEHGVHTVGKCVLTKRVQLVGLHA